MSVKLKIITIICFLILILPIVPIARSQTVAVFPVDDLSRGINNFNLLITRYLAYKMVAKGLNVIQEQEIIDFMSSKRIHWLGYLDTENILQTKKILCQNYLDLIERAQSRRYSAIVEVKSTYQA
jgi:hypothetical protein